MWINNIFKQWPNSLVNKIKNLQKYLENINDKSKFHIKIIIKYYKNFTLFRQSKQC